MVLYILSGLDVLFLGVFTDVELACEQHVCFAFTARTPHFLTGSYIRESLLHKVELHVLRDLRLMWLSLR